MSRFNPDDIQEDSDVDAKEPERDEVGEVVDEMRSEERLRDIIKKRAVEMNRLNSLKFKYRIEIKINLLFIRIFFFAINNGKSKPI